MGLLDRDKLGEKYGGRQVEGGSTYNSWKKVPWLAGSCVEGMWMERRMEEEKQKEEVFVALSVRDLEQQNP